MCGSVRCCTLSEKPGHNQQTTLLLAAFSSDRQAMLFTGINPHRKV
jgi:hypothetical protein